MSDIEAIAEEFRQELGEDYVGLWRFFRVAFERTGKRDPNDLQEVVLGIVASLFDAGGLSVGQFESKKFVEWNGTPDEIIARIRRECRSLGRAPNIGEICWFTVRSEETV